MATATPKSVKVNNPIPRSATKSDNEGANERGQKRGPATHKVSTPWPWKTLLGLGLILTELWLNTGIIWGSIHASVGYYGD